MNSRIWNVGCYRESFPNNKIPSTRSVLQVFFYHHRKQKLTVPTSCKLTAKAVHRIWEDKKRQPQRVWYISKKIQNLFSSWRKLLANRKKSQDCYKLSRKKWRDSSRFTFDVSSKSRKTSRPSESPMACTPDFVLESDLSDGNSEWDDTASDCSEPLTKKQKIKPWNNETLTLLDRAMVTDTAASAILTATAIGLGLDTDLVASSRSSVYRLRGKARVEQMNNAQNNFSVSEAIVIHIDTKRMKKNVGQETEERLAVTVSGYGIEQIVGVPVISSGTGKDIAEAVLKLLEEKGIKNSVKCICYDTTAANSGIRNGSVAILEKELGRSLLHLPCRHHILELILEAVFTNVLKEKSNGPEIAIFKRFQKAWPNINKSSYKSAANMIPSKTLSGRLQTIQDLFKMDQIRADYKELVELAALLLGVTTLNGVQINIKSPGAMHRARWMSRALYSLKIYLFREQFKLTKMELQALRRINRFIILIYLDAWFAAPSAQSAPRHDLQLIQKLKSYGDSGIKMVAENKLSRHLDYLSTTNICLALFDEKVSEEVKKKIIDIMQDKTEPTAKKIKTCNRKQLSGFVSPSSKLFFKILNIETDFFDEQDASKWEKYESFRSAKILCESLSVVNDSAERAVALGEKYNNFGTMKEKDKQAIIVNVFNNRKKIPSLTKKNVIEQMS